jgi:hypothetical protein
MQRGFIKFWRCSEDSRLYFSESFTKWQAWMDLVMIATFEPKTAFVRNIAIPLERGQALAGDEFLAERWKWSRGKVRRFLAYLSSESIQQIVQHNNHVCRYVTICNYDYYQDRVVLCDTGNGTANKATDGTTGGTSDGTQLRSIKNLKKNNTATEIAGIELPQRQEKVEQVVDSELAMKAIQHVQTQWGIAESEAGRINNVKLPGNWKRRDKDNCIQRTAEEQGLDFVLQVEPWVFQTVRNIAKAKNIAFGWGTVAWYLTTPEFHVEKEKRKHMAAKVETPVQPKEPEKPDTTLEDFRKLPDSERQQWIERARGMPFAGKNERWIEKSAAGLWKTETSKGLTA